MKIYFVNILSNGELRSFAASTNEFRGRLREKARERGKGAARKIRNKYLITEKMCPDVWAGRQKDAQHAGKVNGSTAS